MLHLVLFLFFLSFLTSYSTAEDEDCVYHYYCLGFTFRVRISDVLNIGMRLCLYDLSLLRVVPAAIHYYVFPPSTNGKENSHYIQVIRHNANPQKTS